MCHHGPIGAADRGIEGRELHARFQAMRHDSPEISGPYLEDGAGKRLRHYSRKVMSSHAYRTYSSGV